MDREERFALGGLFAWFAITAIWWALAFAPLPVSDEWLAATRSVCFGTLANGLPDSWGWMLLILAPASMLTFLLVVWGAPLRRALGAVLRRPVGPFAVGRQIAFALVVAVALGGLLDVASRVTRARILEQTAMAAIPEGKREPLPEGYPRGTMPAPPLVLVDQTGAAFDLVALRGRPVFLTFAYGHCATVCPALVSALRGARTGYPGTPPAAVVVTLDPWRDTPGALTGIAEVWDLDAAAGGHLLSGTPEAVVAAAEAFEVGFERNERTGEITHAGLVFVLDAEGRIAYKFLGPPAHWLAEAALRLEPARG